MELTKSGKIERKCTNIESYCLQPRKSTISISKSTQVQETVPKVYELPIGYVKKRCTAKSNRTKKYTRIIAPCGRRFNSIKAAHEYYVANKDNKDDVNEDTSYESSDNNNDEIICDRESTTNSIRDDVLIKDIPKKIEQQKKANIRGTSSSSDDNEPITNKIRPSNTSSSEDDNFIMWSISKRIEHQKNFDTSTSSSSDYDQPIIKKLRSSNKDIALGSNQIETSEDSSSDDQYYTVYTKPKVFLKSKADPSSSDSIDSDSDNAKAVTKQKPENHKTVFLSSRISNKYQDEKEEYAAIQKGLKKVTVDHSSNYSFDNNHDVKAKSAMYFSTDSSDNHKERVDTKQKVRRKEEVAHSNSNSSDSRHNELVKSENPFTKKQDDVIDISDATSVKESFDLDLSNNIEVLIQMIVLLKKVLKLLRTGKQVGNRI